MRRVWLLIALLFTLCGGCRGDGKGTLTQVVAATATAADAAYGLSVEVCDAREQRVIARQGSTEDKDRADLAKVRRICDKIFMAFDGARNIGPLVEELQQLSL